MRINYSRWPVEIAKSALALALFTLGAIYFQTDRNVRLVQSVDDVFTTTNIELYPGNSDGNFAYNIEYNSPLESEHYIFSSSMALCVCVCVRLCVCSNELCFTTINFYQNVCLFHGPNTIGLSLHLDLICWPKIIIITTTTPINRRRKHTLPTKQMTVPVFVLLNLNTINAHRNCMHYKS